MQKLIYNHSHGIASGGIHAVFIIILLLIQVMYLSPIHAQAAHDEIVADSPGALQEALNSDAAIIRISPQNEENTLFLDKALTIPNNRTVTLVADTPTKIIGANGQWQFITSPNTNVTIQFVNVILDGNNQSGGIYNRGILTLENAVIQNCYNNNGGAAIYSIDSLAVNNSTFTNNVSNPNNYCDGGAIYARGLTSNITVDILNSNFINNNARYGGAVRFDNAGIHVTNCEFSDNTAVQGSGIYIADSSLLDVTNCKLTNNTGSGAVFVNNSILLLTDSTVSDNNGRGIYGYAEGGNVNITVNGNTIVSGNAARTSYGGGIIGYTGGASQATINIAENAVISYNEAANGGGVSSFPDSNVIINMSGNAQILNNTAYENGGGIYGNGAVNISGGMISLNAARNGGGIYAAPDTPVNIAGAVISDNAAEQDGGGIWINNLSNLTANNLSFQNNSASAGHFWRVNSPADERQLADAAIHNERIVNTSYTAPYTNAYNNYDINYIAESALTPFTVAYNANNNDSRSTADDQNNPYLTGELVTILPPPESFVKSGYTFVGWNTQADGMGNQYSYDKGKVQFYPQTFAMGTGNVVLYAQWKKINTTPQQPLTEAGTPQETNPQSPAETESQEPIPDGPPGYQPVQLDDNTITLQDSDGTAVGRWENTDNGWTYEPDSDTARLMPLEDGSYEVTDQDNNALGLWNRNENDDWVYEEYPASRWNALWLCIPALLVLGAFIFFLIFLRRRITREEFVRMIVRAIHLEAEIEDTPPYSDISEDDKYYDAVMSAKAVGLLTGFPDSEFQPEVFITREEMSSILAETIRYAETPMPSGYIDLSDVFRDFDEMNESFINDIQLVVQLEIIQEKADGIFEPRGFSTRRQAFIIIKNLLAIADIN